MSYYYAIIPSSSKHIVNWNEAKPTTYNSISCSLDNTKIIMSWSGSNSFPSSIAGLPYKEGPYPINQFSKIITGSEWKI